MAAKDDNEEVESSSKKKSSKSKKLIIIAIVLVILIAIGIAVILLFNKPQENTSTGTVLPEETEAIPQTKPVGEAGITYDLPVFVVNLADPSGSRYLRVGISVEMSPKDKKLTEEVEQRLPKIKDVIITALSSKTLEEIATSQGKISLKQELLRRVNATLSSGKLLDVYLTEFVVQ